MQSNLFNDVSKLVGSAIHNCSQLRHDIESLCRYQVENIMKKMDLVTKNEFEVVKEMAAKARTENIELRSKISELEAAIKEQSTGQ